MGVSIALGFGLFGLQASLLTGMTRLFLRLDREDGSRLMKQRLLAGAFFALKMLVLIVLFWEDSWFQGLNPLAFVLGACLALMLFVARLVFDNC